MSLFPDSASSPALPDDNYLATLPAELPEMSFILGSHRSGTTFLYQALVDTGRFNYIRPFDLICFDRLLAGAAEGTTGQDMAALDAELRAGQSNRGLDECPAGADVPEEYGYILPKQGPFSLFSPSVTPATRGRFELLCRKKLRLDPARRPLLLKNPDDFYANIPALHAAYPKARMVFIHRHPLAVLNSQLKAWTDLLKNDNAYIARLHPFYRQLIDAPMKRRMMLEMLKSKMGVTDLFNNFAKGYRNYLDAVRTLPSGSWMSLRYEDLCTQPDERLAEVSRFLAQPAPTPGLAAAVKPRPMKLLPNVEAVYDAMAGEVSEYLAAHNYALRPEGASL
jgi:hypothetical protein